MNALKDRVALVTGGNRGVGKAIAMLFAQEGAHVVVNHRFTANHTVLSTEVPGLQHMFIQADVSSSDDVRSMFARIEKRYGGLDILVNNAGINQDGVLRTLTETMWDEVLATNLKGPFLCAQMAAPLMLRRNGGAIVNISAETALNGRAGACNYVSAKAGLIGLTKALAKELAPHIRVNCVALGYTQTDELVKRLNLNDTSNLRRVSNEVPLGRIGSPEEAAQAVLFLSCDQSSFVTGQVFAVGGGRWM